MKLDSYDLAILALVETDNTRTHQQIADEVHLSPSAVRRRLKALNTSGVIAANVAITDISKISMTFIVRVQMHDDQLGVATNFEKRIAAEPAVSQCYAISGDYDYLLIVHAKSPEAFEKWGETNLVIDAKIRRYDTSLVWGRRKFSTQILPAELET